MVFVSLSVTAAPKQPNILFIFSDDHAFAAISAYNDPRHLVQTPNIDRLAREGTRFTDAHAPTSVCSPTRYAILTGRYSWRTQLQRGVLGPWNPPLIAKDRLTVGKLLQQHGYVTACIGKWHLGLTYPTTDGQTPSAGAKNPMSNVDFTKPIGDAPTTRGFDHYFGTIVPNYPPYCFVEDDHTVGIPSVREGTREEQFNIPGPMLPGWKLVNILPELTRHAVKWIEDKTGNLISTGFGRDVYLQGEMALRKDGKILGLRMHTISDHGAFFSDAQPSKFKIGLMHSAFACYDIPAAHLTATGMYTNKAPGGVAYRCSFRVTEAMFFQERMVQAAADDLGMDQAEFRRVNFVRDDDFPHRTAFGFLTDSGQYGKCLDVGLEAIGYQDFLKEQEEARKRGRLLGIGISTMTEPLGAGNSREYDILGIKMFDSAELRVHMTGKAILRTGAKTQGQGHETTWAQIVAHELGIPADDIVVEEGDTDTAPFGMGTYASRSTPVAGAAVAMVSRKIRAKARKIAAHLLEVSDEDIEWELGRFYVRSSPDRGVSIQECAMAAYSNVPDGLEPGLENTAYYDPPNLTWPFACYIATVEIDPETGVWDVLRMVAVDDCGVRINPMIVEGQIMGGLTEAYAMASMQFITFDAEGNCIGSNYMDYLLPTAWETPGFELHEVVTPCPHHPIGAKGIGECATVGGPAAFVNAVMNALNHMGVRNIDMPLLPDRVYEAIQTRSDISGAPPVRTDLP